MPGLVAPLVDEREVLLAFLGQQRDALRYAAHGLDREQVAARPTVSELSLAGLIKHAALVERAWTTFLTTGDTAVFAPGRGRLGRRVPPDRRGDARRRARPGRRSGAHDREGGRSTGGPRRAPSAHDRRRPVDSRAASSGRPAGSCCTSLRRRPGTPDTPTSSASPSTAPPAGPSWPPPRDGPPRTGRRRASCAPLG